MKWFVILHVLGACIWVGGHLILSIRILPEVLKTKNLTLLLDFEKRYESIGLPALLLQLASGIWLGLKYNPHLIGFENEIQSIISIKLILMLLTLILGIHARFFIFPKLTEKNLSFLAVHVLLVTFLSLVFLYLGISVRFGGI